MSCSALLVVVGSGRALHAQQPTSAEATKPLSYDTSDLFKTTSESNPTPLQK